MTEDEDKFVVIHVTPKIDETCDHDWAYEDGPGGWEEPTHCVKCGLSWTRYIFCCMP